MKKIAILGSTGSIGVSTLKVIEANPGVFSVNLLAAESNANLIFEQCQKFNPRYIYLKQDSSAKELKDKLSSKKLNTSVVDEDDFLKITSGSEVDIVVAGIVGVAGLKSVHAAVLAGKRILLANKESYVVAGELLNKLADLNKANIFPIDSEHSAIHQCLAGKKDTKDEVKRLVLTGSGGPFLDRNIKDFAYITPEEAVKHPVWSMGEKISVDSATMMNKGLEVIEAKWLFKLDPEKIEILIHPEGIVHSLVEFQDASVIAQMSVPDMKIPIAYGLGFPERIKSTSNSLRLEEIGQLNFSRPDLKKFPSIKIAREALISGGTASTLLNAANEEAVGAFLNKKISFIQIPEIISFVMDTIPIKTVKELGSILEADALGRESAINRMHQVNN
ncbi:MAG: 1-deoxy-D-xylulose-5-phosphate reductoisomerase [Thaumarchaeota archaeon]|nr:1-deoxy-D-xylulose-5-phosphate reductoisomerase [Nitrososphaerota archaeon]